MRKKSLELVTKQEKDKLINFYLAHKLAIEELLKEKKIEIVDR